MPVNFEQQLQGQPTPAEATNIGASTDNVSSQGTYNPAAPTMQGTNSINNTTAGVNTTLANDSSASNTQDANSIKVTISDTQAPIIVLFGPPACGKTMTLVRMSRFLKTEGYTISPVRTFRSSSDARYKDMCDKFDQTMNSDYKAEGTGQIDFMLVEVIKDGRRVCQLLEAPGEHYFNPNDPTSDFTAYLNTLINYPNRKVWVIMVEPDWKDSSDRKNYVTRIADLKKKMRTRDAAIFVYNKVDKTAFVVGIGRIRTSSALREVKNQYPGIFAPFKNVNPITKIWKEYNSDFVPFQTGSFTDTSDGKTSYQDGPREFCVKLWKCITKKIRG